MTSSYSLRGYAGHMPDEDLGVISPTAAVVFSLFAEQSMAAMRHFVMIWAINYLVIMGFTMLIVSGRTGFRRYLAIDQEQLW
ncbi:MAG: hypothetical protein R2788_22085 [Saprospiraceae bacterium]